jgi:hypothetical protein
MINKTIDDITLKMANNYDLILAAYHEAGHIICSLLHFIKVTCSYVYEKNNVILGKTNIQFIEYENCNDILYINSIESNICMMYAGTISEKYFYKSISGSNKIPNFIKTGAIDDLKNICNLLTYNKFICKKKLIKKVQKIIKQYWNDITLIAFALIKNNKLYFSNLKDILIKKSKNKIFWTEHLSVKFFSY